jgi:hypothetical protein
MGAESFLEPRDCGYWAVGTCLSLDSRVNVFREGHTGESPCQFLPVLTLVQVDDYWGWAGNTIIYTGMSKISHGGGVPNTVSGGNVYGLQSVLIAHAPHELDTIPPPFAVGQRRVGVMRADPGVQAV